MQDCSTDFEFLPIDVNLIRCMRYLERSYTMGTLAGTATAQGFIHKSGNSVTGGNVMVPFRFIIPKRATPTMTGYSTLGGTGVWDYNRDGASGEATANFDNFSIFGGRIYIGSIGANWTVALVGGHYVADCEL